MDAEGEAFKAWSTSRGVAWASALALRFDDDDDDDDDRPELDSKSKGGAESKGDAESKGSAESKGDADDDDAAEIPASAHTRSRGRYLVVVEAVEADSRLVSVPLTELVTAERAYTSERVGGYLRELAEAYGLDERLAILLYLVGERTVGPASTLAPWIALWPRSFATPVYYGPTTWAALAGTQLYLAAKSKLSTLVTEYEALRADADRGLASADVDLAQFTLEAWVWADAVYRTRVCEGPFLPGRGAHGPSDADGANDAFVAAIIPVVDFANHGGADANARWMVDDDAGYVHLVSNRPIAPGEEVRINYGNKGSEELLYQYGFTLADNPFERLVLVPPLASDESTLTEQLEYIRMLGVPPRLVFEADGNPVAALRMARILTLDDDARAVLLERLETPDVAPEDAFEPLTEANEVAAVALLRQIVTNYLRDLDPRARGRQRSRSQEAADMIFPADDQEPWTRSLPPVSSAETTRRLVDVQRYRWSQIAVAQRAMSNLSPPSPPETAES